MPSQNITALTNAAAFAPDALFYMAISPFGVTDDRKITGSVLFTTIEPLDNNTAALVVTNSALPTVPQIVFKDSANTRRMQIDMSGGATITDTFDEVSIYSTVAAKTLSMGIWNAIDTGEAAEFFLYTGAAGLNHTRLRSVDSGAGGANWLDIASSGVLMTSNATPGGLILLTDLAAPIVFVTGGTALGNEKGRFDAAGFTLGKVSSITGALNLANAASAFLTTITAGNAAAARTYVWPTNFGASGAALTDAAGNGILSWVVPAAGGMAIGGTVTSGTAGSVLFVNAGPILAQDNANFFWDDTNNRLGLGTATPAKLLHVNGIAQLGTVSATTGQLQLANSASANLTTIQAGNAAAARTYTWPTDFGASGSVLTDAAGDGVLSWATGGGGTAPQVRAFNSVNQSINNATLTYINLDSERFDTDAMHFTSSANLTGTVTKTATSATLVGAGTSFTTELSVGQVIMVPGTANERRVVTAIGSDTSLTVAVAFANTAAAQTGVRQNSCLVARTAGTYQITAQAAFDTNGSQQRFLQIGLNTNVATTGTLIWEQGYTPLGAAETRMSGTTLYQLNQWDFVDMIVFQNSGGGLNIINGSNSTPEFMMIRISSF